MSYEIDEKARRCWQSSDVDSQMRCYLGMKGRVSLRDLIGHFVVNYPHVDPMNLYLNFATVTWEEPPTDDDQAHRDEWKGKQAQRQERWERETYDRLRAKYDSAAS